MACPDRGTDKLKPVPPGLPAAPIMIDMVCTAILLACAGLLQPKALWGDTVPVRHTEGLMHGFLLLRTLDGKSLADGQITQDARGDRVTAHLIFRFKDGSIYEERTIFSQRGSFRLLSDHLIQKGPSFNKQWTL